MKFKLAFILLAFGSLSLAAVPASAHDGPLGCYGSHGYGYLYRNLDFEIPYYAAYPPVYYSYPVPRTYGYSPFAYPPGTMTPDVIIEEPVEPVTILNPYVKQEEDSEAESEEKVAAASQAPKPLVIVNPHVPQAQSFVHVAD